MVLLTARADSSKPGDFALPNQLEGDQVCPGVKAKKETSKTTTVTHAKAPLVFLPKRSFLVTGLIVIEAPDSVMDEQRLI